MTQKDLLLKTIWSDRSIDFIYSSIANIKDNKGIKDPGDLTDAIIDESLEAMRIAGGGFKIADLYGLIDEIVAANITDSETVAFQFGVDYALTLLGHPAIFDSFKESEPKTNKKVKTVSDTAKNAIATGAIKELTKTEDKLDDLYLKRSI